MRAVVRLVLAQALAGPTGAQGVYDEHLAPFFARHCVACHGEAEQKGGLDFRRYPDRATALADLGLFEEVRRRLLGDEMPPATEPRPDAEALAEVVAWIDAALAQEGRALHADPGRPVLRRLTRLEYRNSVRDLFGVHFEAEDVFPPDDVGSGFDNDGSVLSLSPLLLERYLQAAETIAERALAPLGPARPVRVEAADLVQPEREHRLSQGLRVLATAGAVGADFDLPAQGLYRLRLRAGAQQAGEELARAALLVDGRELACFEVSATVPELELFEAERELPAGRRRIEVSFPNDYYEPTHADPLRRDRNLHVAWLELEGPLSGAASVGPATSWAGPLADLFPVIPAEEPPDLEPIVARLARRVWRRAVEPDELAGLVAVAAPATPAALVDGDWRERLGRVIVALLVSPHFLFKVELDPLPPAAGERDRRAAAGSAHSLSPHELATRLSYLLWSSTPDAQLSQLADEGRLADPAVLRSQTRRLLRDARASALVAGFFAQWLQLDRLDDVAPDRTRYPDFDDELRASMRAETELFVEALLREERPVEELLLADFSFLDERLARHYRVEGIDGRHMRRVRLADGVRRGLLGHASLLTLTSNPGRTSPVKRGKWVLEVLLASPPKPPPPGVGVLPEPDALAAGSLRERLAAHRAAPECATCHAELDPAGFALENFDAVGRWRATEAGLAIDASGELRAIGGFDGALELGERVAASPLLRRSIVEHLLAYALGRALSRSDRGVVEGLLAGFEGRTMTFPDLLEATVQCDPFRLRGAGAPD